MGHIAIGDYRTLMPGLATSWAVFVLDADTATAMTALAGLYVFADVVNHNIPMDDAPVVGSIHDVAKAAVILSVISMKRLCSVWVSS